jgi:hypothetical protein
MLGATKVGEEAAAATVTAVIRAETGTAITTAVDGAHVHDLVPLTAITGLAMTESLVNEEIVAIDETGTLGVVGMTTVGKQSAKKATHSLLRMSEIAVLCLFNSLLLVSAPVS